EVEPVLADALAAPGVDERFAGPRGVALRGRAKRQPPGSADDVEAQRAAQRSRDVRRIARALTDRQSVEKLDPLAIRGLVASNQERVGSTAMDRYRIEELAPEILVGVAEPELAGRYIDEAVGDLRGARQSRVDLTAFAGRELEGLHHLRIA